MAIIKIQGYKEKQHGIYYELDSGLPPIGVGGMGQVYKGMRIEERTNIRRPVAIKFLYADLPPQVIERSRREASIQLRNDNLVEMLGFIETTETSSTGEIIHHYHVVSELLTGVSLSDIFEGKTKDCDGNNVPFAVKMLQDYRNDPSHFAQTILIGVLSGLMALHDAGYIHRDIDPSNIMLTNDGHIKLIDYGIAKQMNTLTTNDKGLTVVGAFMGKPEYAAPELALGDIKHQNQTTDIYAVGILLYQCIVGHTPFEGTRHEILERQIKGKLPLGLIKNQNLRKIISIACEKNQELRYQSAAQMRVALENMIETRKVITPMYKNAIIYACTAIVLLLIIIAVGIMHHQKETLRELAKIQEQKIRFKEIEQAKEQIRKVIQEANEMWRYGKNHDSDDYENQLMRAYLCFEEAEHLALSVNATLVDSIAAIKTSVALELDSAFIRFLCQWEQAAVLDLPDTAIYSRRANEVKKFAEDHIIVFNNQAFHLDVYSQFPSDD